MAKIDQLIALYVKTDERLRALVQSLEDGNLSNRRINQIYQQIDQIIAELTGQSGTRLADILGDEYRTSATGMVQQLTAAGMASDAINSTLKTIVHQNAAQAIMDEAFYSILEANDNMRADAKKRIKEAVQKANRLSLTEGVSKREATRQAIMDINSRGITGIIAKNGAQIPADKYMAGVVHYHQRKAHVTGAENMAVQNGQDLVYVNSVGITCELCAKYQGRVYSISGNDKRFPKLDVRPPYHSHCVHSFYAWIEEYTPTDEVEQMIAASNRPFLDNRTEQNIKRYNELRQKKAQLNADTKQWKRYRAVLTHDAPKSLAAFRRMKYNGSTKWSELQGNYRKMNAYSKIVANEPAITADLAKIAETTGVDMVGLEFRLKSRESYLRKVGSDSGNSTDPKIIDETISSTNDVIRYTYQASPDNLKDSYFAVVGEMEAQGYTRFKLKNTWLDKRNPYKGINGIYVSPSGQKFEVQFHTPESFELKNGELHSLYEKWRVMPNKADPEAIRLSKQMAEISSRLQVPDGIDEVR